MGVIKVLGLVLVTTVVGAACTKTVNECNSDSDCKDVAYPFCDVNGEFAASGGAKNVCTIVPPDCPIERCGCSPGATTCSSDQLSVCNSDGKSATLSACALGCATTNDRCKTFVPSNGLNAALVAAVGTSDVIIPDGSTLDTNTGMIFDPSHFPISVGSIVVTQTNGIDIRAYYALSFDLGSVTITGSKAVAFVATGPVTVSGLVTANARGHTPGAGATISGACIGPTSSGNSVGGGGGNATAGGRGVDTSNPTPVPGGDAQAGFGVLAGGCMGGGANGGGGGGAIQIDSLTKITVNPAVGARRGILNVGGGGGGDGAGGGGSGGLVVLESPQVVIGGAITANGGGGGGGLNDPGADATPDGSTAFGGSNSQFLSYGGSGATISSPVGDAYQGGAGGGALGRLYVKSADGTFSAAGSSLISATPVSSTLVIQ